MLGAEGKNGSDGVKASFRIAIESFRNGLVRRQSFIAESVVVPGDSFHRQAGVFEQRRAADLAGDDLNSGAIGPIKRFHVHILPSS